MTDRDMARSDTGRAGRRVFISYSHDSDLHSANVLDLAQTLRRNGLDVMVDRFVEDDDPPESWPVWMAEQVEQSDFVLMFFTETYARSFNQRAAPGTRRGSSWEGRIITAELYRRETGKGTRMIPIIARSEDEEHIPSALSLGAYYDVGVPGRRELTRLLRRLTGQPGVRPDELGDVPYLPSDPPESPESTARVDGSLQQLVGLLDIAESGIPVAVATGMWENLSIEDLEAEPRVRVVDDWLYRHRDERIHHIYLRPKKPAAARVLSHLLDYIEERPDCDEMADLVASAMVLATFSWEKEPKHSTRLFRVLERHLKRRGDKKLVRDAAEISVRASKHPGRVAFDAECEAHALVAGVAWVYQRVGSLQEARSAAERSLLLGRHLRWGRNSAFCLKRIGTLLRLEAEQSSDPEPLLAQSERHLADAVKAFEALPEFGPDDPEVGDCYSALARSYLTWGRIAAAERAAREAETLIPEGINKAYLDLLVLQGDLAVAHREFVDGLNHYDSVLSVAAADAEISELVARARAQRGRLFREMDAKARAEEDFVLALEEFDQLGEIDSAAHVAWDLAMLRGELPQELRAELTDEPAPVRREAIEIMRERVEESSKQLSHKTGFSTVSAKQIVKEARQRIAIKGSPW